MMMEMTSNGIVPRLHADGGKVPEHPAHPRIHNVDAPVSKSGTQSTAVTLPANHRNIAFLVANADTNCRYLVTWQKKVVIVTCLWYYPVRLLFAFISITFSFISRVHQVLVRRKYRPASRLPLTGRAQHNFTYAYRFQHRFYRRCRCCAADERVEVRRCRWSYKRTLAHFFIRGNAVNAFPSSRL